MTTAADKRAEALHNTPIGSKEIAHLLGVAEGTVAKWATRNILPDPVEGWAVSGRPVWRKLVILVWAFHTNRMRPSQLVEAGLKRTFDVECARCFNGEGPHCDGCTSPAIIQSVVDSLVTKRIRST